MLFDQSERRGNLTSVRAAPSSVGSKCRIFASFSPWGRGARSTCWFETWSDSPPSPNSRGVHTPYCLTPCAETFWSSKGFPEEIFALTRVMLNDSCTCLILPETFCLFRGRHLGWKQSPGSRQNGWTFWAWVRFTNLLRRKEYVGGPSSN